ncbi:MAG: hypothetical protein ICV64_10660, partial [Thermoleophilia bacterium]|nr:hypothetical protein [Thermoleophilia bacterium]
IVRGSRTVRAFDLEQERRMHLIVVRRDLFGFRHLHPRMRPDGTWMTRLRFAEGGAYRLFADFVTAGRRATLGVDVFVRGPIGYPLPIAEPRPVRAGPYTVALRRGRLVAERPATLAFRVTRAGRLARLGRYLGARGHLVVLRAGDLAYLHTHADEESLAFETTFPSAGSYRAFLQFRAGGRVRTAAFTFRVRP